MRQLTTGGVAIRFVVAASLVCLTWNPTAYNYTRWAMANWPDLAAVIVFVGNRRRRATLRAKGAL